MSYRTLTQPEEIPDRFFPAAAPPPTYRGKVWRDKLHSKTSDLSKIPEFICIKIEEKKGDSPKDWETAHVKLKAIDKDSPLPPIGDPVLEKEKRLRGLKAANFHYLEESNVSSLYDDVFAAPLPNPSPVINEVTVEIQDAIKGNAQASIADVVQSVLSRERVERIFTQIKFVEIATSTKFIQYQKRMIEEGQVILDLELQDQKSADLAKFDGLIRQMSDYELQVDLEKITNTRKQLGEGTINEILGIIENSIDQQVVITADFHVSDEGNSYRLSYEHPINRLIDQKIEMWVTLSKKKVLANWNLVYEQSCGNTVRANVYGTVFRSKKQHEGDWEIAVNPIAVYS